MNSVNPTEKSPIERLAISYIDHLDQTIQDMLCSKLAYLESQNRGKLFGAGDNVEWGEVFVKDLFEEFEITSNENEQELFYGLSPTLLCKGFVGEKLFLEEIDCYRTYPIINGALMRPVIPLIPKFIGVMSAIFDDGGSLQKDGEYVINFPVKNGHPDWEGFKLLAHELSESYPLNHINLMKIREPESIDIGLRESIVATFSEELRELRQSTFDYYRDVYDLQMMLDMVQRNHDAFKESTDKTPYNYKIIANLLDEEKNASLLNIARSTADIYELNYPQTVESVAVRHLMDHVSEIIEQAISKSAIKDSNGEVSYDHREFHDLFTAINILLELLREIVEMKQYSYYRPFLRVEF